ncbi:MAG: GNAT family N-acetyltransferase [Bacteroidetes bacterium]|nr:GNAT family N-acetyltransferase [Bacteroidota bacterium]
MTELGYPVTREQMASRFQAIDRHTDYRTLVAEYNGKVAGMAGLVKGIYYEHDGIYVRVVAFIVNSAYRKKGIGLTLLKACEMWAANLGAAALLLSSGNRDERADAFRFYQSHGFVITSSGFVKKLAER